MSWLQKIFNTELVKGYKLDKDDQGFLAGTNKMWKVLRGIRVKDNTKISFFILNKKKLPENYRLDIEEFFINESKNQIRIRHPSFL